MLVHVSARLLPNYLVGSVNNIYDLIRNKHVFTTAKTS